MADPANPFDRYTIGTRLPRRLLEACHAYAGYAVPALNPKIIKLMQSWGWKEWYGLGKFGSFANYHPFDIKTSPAVLGAFKGYGDHEVAVYQSDELYPTTYMLQHPDVPLPRPGADDFTDQPPTTVVLCAARLGDSETEDVDGRGDGWSGGHK